MTPRRDHRYKRPGPPHPRASVHQERLPAAVHDEGARLHTQRPVGKSLRSEKTFPLPGTSQALPRQRWERPPAPTRVVGINLSTRAPTAARAVLPATRLPPKHRNRAAGSASRSLRDSSRKRPGPTASWSTCQPRSRIFFLKTHKTAGSTVLNILYRYGEARNLTFALPLSKHSQLFYPHFFASHFVEGVSSRSVKEFNIMCNHMRFRKSEVSPGGQTHTRNKSKNANLFKC